MDAQTTAALLDAGKVAFGAALGAGVTAFSDWRKSRKHAKAVKVAISRELGEISYRLIALIYMLSQGQLGWNRELLEWISPVVQRYSGPNSKDGMMKGIAGLLKSTDDNLAVLAAHLRANARRQLVPSESAVYTAEAVHEFHNQDAAYAVRVLDILTHLRMFNEVRENGLFHTRLTFTKLSDENHATALEGIAESERQMVWRARIIVDKISALDAKYPQK